MTRKSNWEAELADFISSRKETEFQWGTHDCALFAADAVLAITGDDPAPDFRGVYSDQAGARQALRDFGNGTLLKTYQIRFDEKAPAFARRGDLIWNGFAIGVCYGEFAMFVGEPDGVDGLIRLPRKEWKRAFHVG
jgi:hypothetical protein